MKPIERPVSRILAFFEMQLDNQLVSITNHLRSHLFATALDMQCPYCEQFQSSLRIRRLNTEYVDDRRNWMFSCQYCFEETYLYYNELWEAFYSEVM